MSKEVPHGPTRPPPRRTNSLPQPAAVLPLEQLWRRLPQAQQHELLRQLTRILTQRLAPPNSKEEADE